MASQMSVWRPFADFGEAEEKKAVEIETRPRAE
jgi:hypothetical protein